MKPGHQKIVSNALRISAVVGSLLNVINQGGEMLEGRVSWLHFALNFLVPFAVATYSGVTTHHDHPDDR
jgi:hypothetical protein